MNLLGYAFIGAGLFFFWISALGLIRMPDFLTRMHAGTKATTLGSLLILVGAGFIQPEWALKLALLAVFLLLTNPLSSSVLARAAMQSGTDTVPMKYNAYADQIGTPAAQATTRVGAHGGVEPGSASVGVEVSR
ncbi:Na+/H+ antiporter subunit G [Thiocapsa imhoffii]|uniref:Na+/H+ antiporter subunit G n=1 Tax=Thiocapsa imhoffii TaxID=382777 RepID=A0A9X1B9W6_9GAMM|nr:Na+/H+ antiporter subunit G [Thiocapsa imhoffii]